MAHAADLHSSDSHVEPEGVDVGAALLMTFASVVLIAILAVIGFQVAQSGFRAAEARATERTGYPMLRETHADAQALLSGYAAVNETTYRIPIDRAIDLMVNEAAALGATLDATAAATPDNRFSDELDLTR